MKLSRILMFALVITAFLIGNSVVSAQEFGRGRLLRQWRDSFSGKQDKLKQAKSPTKNQRQQPTAAKKTNQQQARSKTNSRSTASRHYQQQQRANANSRQRQPTPADHTQRHHAQPTQNSTFKQVSNAKPAVRKPQSRAPQSAGFGMSVQANKSDQLVITQIHPTGNAAQSGAQRGDIITHIGGIEVAAIEEYQGITQVLSSGEEMEFSVSRRGQKKTFSIPFGESNQPETPIAQPVLTPGKPVTGRYDFVPQPAGLSTTPTKPRSVLSATPISNRTTPQSNRTVPDSMSLKQTVIQQQATIRQLQNEVERLRRSQSRQNNSVIGSGLK